MPVLARPRQPLTAARRTSIVEIEVEVDRRSSGVDRSRTRESMIDFDFDFAIDDRVLRKVP
jgi:hypothetical protein